MPQASQLDLSQDKISHFVHGSSNIKMPAELEKNMIHQTMELDIDYERAGILHKGQKATDRKSTRLNSSHQPQSRMPSSA